MAPRRLRNFRSHRERGLRLGLTKTHSKRERLAVSPPSYLKRRAGLLIGEENAGLDLTESQKEPILDSLWMSWLRAYRAPFCHVQISEFCKDKEVFSGIVSSWDKGGRHKEDFVFYANTDGTEVVLHALPDFATARYTITLDSRSDVSVSVEPIPSDDDWSNTEEGDELLLDRGESVAKHLFEQAKNWAVS